MTEKRFDFGLQILDFQIAKETPKEGNFQNILVCFTEDFSFHN